MILNDNDYDNTDIYFYLRNSPFIYFSIIGSFVIFTVKLYAICFVAISWDETTTLENTPWLCNIHIVWPLVTQ